MTGILLVGVFVRESGIYSVGEDLAKRLKNNGKQVWLTSKKHGRWVRLLDMLGTIWQLRKQYNIAVVDVYSGAAFVWAEIACFWLRYLNKPYVLVLRGGNLPIFAERFPQRMRRLLKSTGVTIAPSGYLLEQMRSYCNKISLLSNPININEYHFHSRKCAQPNLIWLRSFHKIYNPTLAPKVLAKLLPEFPNSHLIMVGPDKGDGSQKDTQDVAKTLGTSDKTNFPGRVQKSCVPQWLNKGDIFLNTTNIDNTPVSVLEAMACGLCVVSTSVGGIPYLLEDGKDALLVPPDDPQAMSSAIRRILTEPGLAEELSMNARKKAKQFDWSVILPQWEMLFLETIRGK